MDNQQLLNENEKLRCEVNELKNWKREQISIWKAVDTHVRYHPEVFVGDSVSKKVLQFLRERDELVEYKKDIEDSFKSIMSERPNDEVHCTCVPFLKMKIKELEATNTFLEADRDRLDSQCYLAENRNTYQNLAHQKEIEGWKNKWKIAVEMAAIAENKLDTIKNAL